MSTDVQQRAKAMLNLPLVAVLARPAEGAQLLPLLDAHFDFMVALEQRGLLFLSGPLSNTPQPPGLGLSILNVDSIAAAQAIWADEPFHRAGLRGAEFFVWNLMEGCLQLRVGLSDQRMQLPCPAAAVG